MKTLLIAIAALLLVAVPAGLALVPAAGETDAALPAPTPASRDVGEEPSAGGSERFSGTQTFTVGYTHPAPTCPLSCTQGASIGSGGVKATVREGATLLVVTATWTPTTPASAKMRIVLGHEDGACGSGCYVGVADAEGAGEATFDVLAPRAGEYLAWASPTGPASLTLRQDVRFEVVVHYS